MIQEFKKSWNGKKKRRGQKEAEDQRERARRNPARRQQIAGLGGQADTENKPPQVARQSVRGPNPWCLASRRSRGRQINHPSVTGMGDGRCEERIEIGSSG